MDYREDAGTVSLAAGELSTSIDITIIDNNQPELNKTFRVELYDAKNGGTVVVNFVLSSDFVPKTVGSVYKVHVSKKCPPTPPIFELHFL